MRKLFSLLAAVLFAGSMMAAEVTDNLTSATTGITGTSYTDFSGKKASSDAVYAGQCAGSYNSIQLRTKNTNSGVITTASGGVLKSVRIKFNSNTTADRAVAVYASNTAYAAATDLFDSSKQGTKVFSFNSSNSYDSTYVFDAEYKFIGICSAKDAIYIDSIVIVWEAAEPAVATPVITGDAEFTDSVVVTITCSTPETDIYYTTDGTTDPKCDCAAAPEYKKPIVIKETTTIKAAAYTGNDWSAVATKTFTKVPKWLEVKFDKVIDKNVLPADTVFADGDFKVALTDTDNKQSIDANSANFGRTDTYNTFGFRLKIGGKSGAKNSIKITVPADGVLRLAVRTGSNGDLTRTLILAQGTDTLFNKAVNENAKREKKINDSTTLVVYPYIYANVKAGDIAVTFPVNGLNFYEFGFLAGGEAPEVLPDPTNCEEAAKAALSVSKNDEIYNDYAKYTIKGYVTKIQTAYSSQYQNITFWMADSLNGGNVLEAYRAVCKVDSNAVYVGDVVEVTGYLTKYNTTPEFAAGCTYKFISKAERPQPKNLGAKTIAEFLALKNTIDTCVLTGVVDSLVNTVYGNFNLVDATGKVYIYGLLTPEGVAQKFDSLGIEAGDTLTVKALYGEYKNAPQVKNAIFVSVKKDSKVKVHIDNNLVYMDATAEEGWWQIYGGSKDFYITLSNANVVDVAPGIYPVDSLDEEYSYLVAATAPKDTILFVDGGIELVVDTTHDVVLIAGVLTGNDGKVYDIKLQYKDPEAKDSVTVSIAEAELVDSYAEMLGVYAIYGFTADSSVYVQVSISTDELAGSYTEADLDSYYLGTVIFAKGVSTEIYTAEFTITPGNGEGDLKLEGDFLCYDNTLYKVTMIVPAAQGIEDVDAAVKAFKSIVNGQVIIEKNGVKYNVVGTRVR